MVQLTAPEPECDDELQAQRWRRCERTSVIGLASPSNPPPSLHKVKVSHKKYAGSVSSKAKVSRKRRGASWRQLDEDCCVICAVAGLAALQLHSAYEPPLQPHPHIHHFLSHIVTLLFRLLLLLSFLHGRSGFTFRNHPCCEFGRLIVSGFMLKWRDRSSLVFRNDWLSPISAIVCSFPQRQKLLEN